jgi:hypothetical protein
MEEKTIKVEGEITLNLHGGSLCTALLRINGEQKYFTSQLGSSDLMQKIGKHIQTHSV